MREGIGIATSLEWVSARFAQRAVEGFYAGGQDREFIIDAATSIELAAKAVIARKDVRALYGTPPDPPLSAHEMLLLDPRRAVVGLELDAKARHRVLSQLRRRRTIDASDALRLALSPSDAATAAGRLLDERNVAVHLGDVDARLVDSRGRDFLSVINSLWQLTDRSHDELWGNLTAVATPTHLRSNRTPTEDAEVRVVLARRRWQALGASAARIGFHGATEASDRCPSCRGHAKRTVQPVGSAPWRCIPSTLRRRPVEVLDCFACGLMLFGQTQIEHAMSKWPSTAPEPKRIDDVLWS